MYIFNDVIKYSGNKAQKIIEDIYVQGGFKILKNIADRDSFPASLLRVGSIIRLQDTFAFWRVKNIVLSYDQDDNEVKTVDWEPYSFGADTAPAIVDVTKLPFEFAHHNFTVSIENVPDSKPIAHEVDLSCYSFFLLNLRVSAPVKVEIFSRKDLLDRNPYTFIAKHDHLIDNGNSFVERQGESGFVLNTSAYNIIANDDDYIGTKYYFRITPMLAMTKDGYYKSPLVTLAFEYVSIET